MVARGHTAAAFVTRKSGRGVRQCAEGRAAAGALAQLAGAAAMACAAAGLLLFGGTAASAASNKVRMTNLSDVAFGTIANLNVDAVRNESLCLYADTSSLGYNITATGTGAGGAFQLSSGAGSMAYDVEWSSAAGQSSGTQLTPNVPLTGQTSSATHQTCNNGPAATASLILVVRSTALSSAAAGTYGGSLTLLVGPE